MEDGACECESQDGENEDDEADDERDHGVVHEELVEASTLCRAEQPEACQLLFLLLIHGLPFFLQVGHIFPHPGIVNNLPTRGTGTVFLTVTIAVVVRGFGKLLPFGGLFCERGLWCHWGMFTGVVEAAAGDVRLGGG